MNQIEILEGDIGPEGLGIAWGFATKNGVRYIIPVLICSQCEIILATGGSRIQKVLAESTKCPNCSDKPSKTWHDRPAMF